MNTFQTTLDETITKASDEKIKDLYSEMLAKKFSDEGVRIGKKRIREMASRLRQGETSLSFDSRRKADLNISIGNKELRWVTSEFNKWLKAAAPKLQKLYPKLANETADVFMKVVVEEQMPKVVKTVRRNRAAFRKNLHLMWQPAFDLLEMYLATIKDITDECVKEFYDSGSTDPVFDLLVRINGRAYQIALEIQALIHSGFADGAHARWRSLHELAVVAMFIGKHGDDVAERYLAHEAIEYGKGAEQFQVYARALKQRAIGKKDITKIRKDRDDAIAKYGKNFRHEYGWASDALGNPKPTFADIEKDVKQDKWRPYYRMASWNVHAGPRGTHNRLGLMKEHQDLILIGASEYGFTDPAQGAAHSLSLVACTMLERKISFDRMFRLLALMKFRQLIADEFHQVQQQLENAIAISDEDLALILDEAN